MYLGELLHALRGWHCTTDVCNLPAAWQLEQTRDVVLLWFGGLRSVLQIHAGLRLQSNSDRKGPLTAYLVVAAVDCAALAAVVALPVWVLVLVAGWPLFVYAITRTAAVRPLVWEPLGLPRARLL